MIVVVGWRARRTGLAWHPSLSPAPAHVLDEVAAEGRSGGRPEYHAEAEQPIALPIFSLGTIR